MSFIRAMLRSSAVETYRIKGLRRKRVTAGGVVLQKTAVIPNCASRAVRLYLYFLLIDYV